MPKRPEIERFMEKVMPVTESGCWLWMGAISKAGLHYGLFKDENDRQKYAHRWYYEYTHGPIPGHHTKIQCDHLCRVPSCVNPDHIEIVTAKINMLRGNGPSAINSKKEHCPLGHDYTFYPKAHGGSGKRRCRTCENAALRISRPLHRKKTWHYSHDYQLSGFS